MGLLPSIFIGIFLSYSITRSLLSLPKGTFIFSWQDFKTAITLSTDSFSGNSVLWIRILVRRLFCSLLSHLISNRSDIFFCKAICSSSSLKADSKVWDFLINENLLKMMKNAFYFAIKALFVLKVFKFLSWLFGHVGKRLD